MTAFRGHLVGDDAVWCGVDWFEVFAISNSNGTPYDLTNFAIAGTVHGYAGSATALVAMVTSIDTPKTAGTGVLSILGSASTALRPGKYVYKVILTPSAATAALQPIVLWGDLEVRTR